MNVGIVGITGYTGLELVRLIDAHPSLTLTIGCAGASAGQPLAQVWPSLRGVTELNVESLDPERLAEACDLVFLAMPHGAASALVPQLLSLGVKVIDLGADFRLKDPSVYATYYGLEHPCPGLLEEAVYGLPELFRGTIADARLIANPGCYPTAVSLAAYPLLSEAQGPIVASCLSGVSGAGRSASERTRYCETADQARAYNIAGAHRHTPEIEQTLHGHPVVFTPHLAPMSRGINASVYIRHEGARKVEEIEARYHAAYQNEEMVVLRSTPPSTGDVRGSNRAHIHVTHDPARQTTTVICVIDNLIKGAAGQAIQSLNCMMGLPESTGLPMVPQPI